MNDDERDDVYNGEPLDDDRVHLDGLFDRDPAPHDVVPGRGLTLADLRKQNDMKGQIVEGWIPGEIIVDNLSTGAPIGVGESRKVQSRYGGTTITTNTLRELGLTREELARDYPNIRLFELPEESDDDDE